MDLVKIRVTDFDAQIKELELPPGIGLSLMEGLKASGYDIQATCGGMALCATCHVNVLEGHEKLDAPADAELEMLDTLPVLLAGSRLSCQIRVEENLDGLSIELIG